MSVLSKLRKLQPVFKKIVETIPNTLFSVTDDPFFIEGEMKGKIEGMSAKTLEIIVNLIQISNHDDDFIARISGVEGATVATIRQTILDFPDDFSQKLEQMQPILFKY